MKISTYLSNSLRFDNLFVPQYGKSFFVYSLCKIDFCIEAVGASLKISLIKKSLK